MQVHGPKLCATILEARVSEAETKTSDNQLAGMVMVSYRSSASKTRSRSGPGFPWWTWTQCRQATNRYNWVGCAFEAPSAMLEVAHNSPFLRCRGSVFPV